MLSLSPWGACGALRMGGDLSLHNSIRARRWISFGTEQGGPAQHIPQISRNTKTSFINKPERKPPYITIYRLCYFSLRSNTGISCRSSVDFAITHNAYTGYTLILLILPAIFYWLAPVQPLLWIQQRCSATSQSQQLVLKDLSQL